MATRPNAIKPAYPNHQLVTWETLSETDADGAGALLLGNGDRTVQVLGTFGGGTITIEGSLDGTNWQPLQDLEGAALTFTAVGLKGILESPPWIRPVIAGATGADVDVLISVNRAA